jgi:anti-sigma regulatory factor (Ser/Thr protein kinase)
MMTRYRSKTKEIRDFIIQNVDDHPSDITALTAEEFRISRPAVLRHIRNLARDDILIIQGRTRDRRYELKPLAEVEYRFLNRRGLEEDRVWREHIRPLLEDVAPNVLAICQYGFTEMLNNVIAHSKANLAQISLKYTPVCIQITVYDDGIGIFQKIQTELGLEDPRHVVLELSKGKLTTDPEHHTGEGIFFTARSFDRFSMLSDSVYFRVENPGNDWLLGGDENEQRQQGTLVTLEIHPQSTRKLQDVFDHYTTGEDDYSFSRTIVPVALAKYGDENLVSRSQARRLLARFERFREVLLDFEDVETIGQAFADEVFRVYHNQHPDVHLIPIGMNEQVKKMISRALQP